MKTRPWTMLLMMLVGWMNRQQQEVIEYLKAENGILRDELLKAKYMKLMRMAKKIFSITPRCSIIVNEDMLRWAM